MNKNIGIDEVFLIDELHALIMGYKYLFFLKKQINVFFYTTVS